MASSVETAITTSTDIPITNPEKQYTDASPNSNGSAHTQTNGHTNGAPNGAASLPTGTKYNHVVAVHRKVRASCLSQDAEKPPSFVGIRNLMILVLRTSFSRPLAEPRADPDQLFPTCD